jgi:pyruvate kinase
MVAKYRPKAPIIAVTPLEQIMRRLSLVWGVTPMLCETAQTTDQLFDLAVDASIQSGIVSLGDIVVITAGVPVGRSGTTNLIKVHQVGEMIAKGTGIGTKNVTGNIVTASSAEEAVKKMVDGAILACVTTDRDYMPALQRAAGLIIEAGGITSHAAVVALSLGIPVIVGVKNLLTVVYDGLEVSIYPQVGVIYSGRGKVL